MSHDRPAVSASSVNPAGASQSGPAHKHAKHPDHVHIDAMIRAGIVTHVVTVNEAIDPPFVVSQIKELPDVDFVAAFQAGLIAFGCRGELPEALAAIARPAVASAPEPAAKIDIAPLAQRIIALEETLATRAAQDGPDLRIAEIRDEIGAIGARLNNDEDKAQLKLIAGAVAAIRNDLGALPAPEPDERIDALQEQLADLCAQQKDAPAAQQLEGIATVLEEIRAELRSSPTTEQTDEGKEVTDQAIAVLTMLVKRVETVAQSITSRTFSDESSLELVELQDRFDQLQLSIGRAGKTEQKNTGKTQRMLQDLLTAVERQTASQVNLSLLEEKLDHLHRQSAEMNAMMAAQQKLVEELAQRPLPQLDLTEQRAEFARFGAGMSASVDRLEDAARELAAEARMPSPQAQDILTAVNRIPQATQDALNKSVNLGKLEGELSGIRNGLCQLPDRLGMAGVERKLSVLSQRSDPSSLLSAQNQQITRFSSSISGVKERLDAMAETLSAVRFERAELETLGETASRIETQMLQLSQQHQNAQLKLASDAQDGRSSQFAAVSAAGSGSRDTEDPFDDMISGRIRSPEESLGAGLAKRHPFNAKDA